MSKSASDYTKVELDALSTAHRYRILNADKRREYAKQYHDIHRKERNDYAISQYYKNQESRIEHTRLWRFNNPEKARALDKNQRERNKEKRRLNCIKWRESNKEHSKEYDRRYHAAHPDAYSIHRNTRKARKLSAVSDDPSIIAQHVNRAKNSCYWCGARLYGRKYHLDHVIPLSKGGNHTASNIVKSCPHCNMSKNDKLPGEWKAVKQMVML